MRVLDRKLFRELGRTKGQALAIAFVIGAGVAMYLTMLSNFDSLELSQKSYYEQSRFADVFASMKRAPGRLKARIAQIPGVDAVETRVVVDVTLNVPDFGEPITGRLVSYPTRRRPLLNDVFIRRGRRPEPARPDEVILSEGFAEAHRLDLGDRIGAVVNGRRRQLEIVGTALSPEYIYSIAPGQLFPDNLRFGVLWMGETALAAAFDMEGGFNDVSLSLQPKAGRRVEGEVIDRLDALLEPYGSGGAILRKRQVSHWYLENELSQLSGMGAIVPMIFLVVAAFLLNVVLSRMVTLQREQIAALKALGYSNPSIGLYYLKWALLVSLVGAVLGIVSGIWLGSGMTRLYTDFFRFPVLEYRMLPTTVLQACLISVVAAVVGALGSVRRVVYLPPAEAMRPEPPARYRVSWVERLGFRRWLSQPARMIFRSLERYPGRASLSILGIALGGAMLIVGNFTYDAINEVTRIQFEQAQRYDAMVSLVEPRSQAAAYELARMPGVIRSEPFRAVPARVIAGHRERTLSILGLDDDADLNRVVDIDGSLVKAPLDGLLMSRKLADVFALAPGDLVEVEILEGARRKLRVPVSALVDEFIGTPVYMRSEALRQLVRESGGVSGTFLAVDPVAAETLYDRLGQIPFVAGIAIQKAALGSFEETLAENMGILRTMNVLFAVIIAFAVIYNNARINLSERSRELASLRVMGFTRGEISYILLGELAVVTLIAIPVGLLLGYGMAAQTIQALDTELWRIPLVVAPPTFALSAVVVLLASVLSGAVVRRRLRNLDLIGVLKTRE